MLTIVNKCIECKLCKSRTVTNHASRTQNGGKVSYQERTDMRCEHPYPPKDGPLMNDIPEDCPIQQEAYMIVSRKLVG